jgi:hypothetical protein
MTFDNSQMALKIQMQKRFFAVISAVFLALLFFIVDFWEFFNRITGLPKPLLAVLFIFIYFSFYIYHIIAGSSFVFFSDDAGKIIIRFYKLDMFNSSKNSYEIPQSELAGYRIEKKFFNIRHNLTVFRRYQGKIVKYPPLSISALTETEKTKLLKALNKYSSPI